MDSDSNKKTYFLEIADVFSEEERFIKFPVNRNDYVNSEENKLPFCTYYYEALLLCSGSKILLDEALIKSINLLSNACIIINESNFLDIKQEVKEISKRIRNYFLNCSIKNGTLYSNQDFESNKNLRIEEIYNEWRTNNKEASALFENNSKKCVAIAYPYFKKLRNDTNSYVSISGCYNDYAGSLKYGSIDSVTSQTYSEINKLLHRIFGYNFIECHLNDYTRRYTYLTSKKGIRMNDIDGRVLKNPVKFCTDFKNLKDRSRLNRHYSCCEKKIIANMNFVNYDYTNLISGKTVINKLSAYIFKVKIEPCRMCRPALIGCYFITYGLYNPRDFFLRTERRTIKYSSTIRKEPLVLS